MVDPPMQSITAEELGKSVVVIWRYERLSFDVLMTRITLTGQFAAALSFASYSRSWTNAVK
jgi:hypothetical protein